MKKMWAVGHNMPGYLPESDPQYTETLQDARDALCEELEWAADHHVDVCEDLGRCDECRDLENAFYSVQNDGALEVTIDKYVYWIHRIPRAKAHVHNVEALRAGPGWYEFIKRPEATTHVAYVHENGDVWVPDTGWTTAGKFALLTEGDEERLIALADVIALFEGVACPVCEDAGVMTRRALADLRAKVEALRRPPIPWVPIDDVLALLPESQ